MTVPAARRLPVGSWAVGSGRLLVALTGACLSGE